MPDAKLIENIIKILQFEYKAYLQLLKTAERKTGYLVQNDISAIEKITEEERVLTDQTYKLSQVREKTIKMICEELDSEPESFTISKLIGFVQEPYKNVLEGLHKRLKELIIKLSARNGINQKLIDSAIKYVNFNMQLIASPQPALPTYGKGGQEVSHSAKRSMLDIKY